MYVMTYNIYMYLQQFYKTTLLLLFSRVSLSLDLPASGKSQITHCSPHLTEPHYLHEGKEEIIALWWRPGPN